MKDQTIKGISELTALSTVGVRNSNFFYYMQIKTKTSRVLITDIRSDYRSNRNETLFCLMSIQKIISLSLVDC